MKIARPDQVNVIPAQPGTKVLLADDDGSGYCSQAIIAWSIVTSTVPDADGRIGLPIMAHPITADGDHFDTNQPWAIQHIDGTITIPRCCGFDNVEEWLISIKKSWDENLTKRSI